MPGPVFFVLSVPVVGEEVLTIHSWDLRVVAVGAQRPSPGVRASPNTAPERAAARRDDRYLAAGSMPGSCLFESAGDARAFAKVYLDEVSPESDSPAVSESRQAGRMPLRWRGRGSGAHRRRDPGSIEHVVERGDRVA
jgi:hypothetical protein